MKNLIELFHKQKRIAAGIMSGTSVDGIDVVLLEITGSGLDTKLKQLGYIEHPFPEGLKELILTNSAAGSGSVDEICTLNALIPRLYASGLQCLCEKINISMDKIDLIGTHGQTIHHLPKKEDHFGYHFGSTLQIGDPAVLAKLTGVITVGDFRTGDIALGGEGAPLVPYFDYLMFRSTEKNCIILNIGGISNFTVLKKNAAKDDVFAFDTGPGNMMIDLLMNKYYNKKYDEDGKIAASGRVNEELLEYMISADNFIDKAPPKSTGREQYGIGYVESLLDKFRNISREDWITTISYFTAYSIFRNYEKFVMHEIKADELIVSGGGAKNKYLTNTIQFLFGNNTDLLTTDSSGIPSDAKEAICFAVLANETISGNSANIPRVTGASRETILGKICLP